MKIENPSSRVICYFRLFDFSLLLLYTCKYTPSLGLKILLQIESRPLLLAESWFIFLPQSLGISPIDFWNCILFLNEFKTFKEKCYILYYAHTEISCWHHNLKLDNADTTMPISSTTLKRGNTVILWLAICCVKNNGQF